MANEREGKAMNEWAMWAALLACAAALVVTSREIRHMRAELERLEVECVWLRGDVARCHTMIDLRRKADQFLSEDIGVMCGRLECLEAASWNEPPVWKHEGNPGPVIRNIQAKEER